MVLSPLSFSGSTIIHMDDNDPMDYEVPDIGIGDMDMSDFVVNESQLDPRTPRAYSYQSEHNNSDYGWKRTPYDDSSLRSSQPSRVLTERDRKLFSSARDNDLDGVEEAMEEGADVDAIFEVRFGCLQTLVISSRSMVPVFSISCMAISYLA